jgi:hypothetical protein
MADEGSEPLDETEEFQILVEILKQHGPWCVFGDLAVNCWVTTPVGPRHSNEANVVVAAAELPGLRDDLVAAGFVVEEYETYLYARLPRGELQIQVMSQFRHQGFCERAQTTEILGQIVPVASVFDVIREKIWTWCDEDRLAVKREKDKQDLVKLLTWYPDYRFVVHKALRPQIPEIVEWDSDETATQ